MAETTTRKRAPVTRKTAVPETAAPAPVKARAPRKPRSETAGAAKPKAPSRAAKPKTAAPTTIPAAAKRAKPGLPRRTSDAPSEQLKRAVLAAIDAMKGRELVVLDVREKTSIMDDMIIVSGTSSRHVKSIAEEVSKAAKKLNLPPIGMEGEKDGEWVIVDLGDYVVHVMLPKMREFYALERLWSPGGDPTPGPLDLA